MYNNFVEQLSVHKIVDSHKKIDLQKRIQKALPTVKTQNCIHCILQQHIEIKVSPNLTLIINYAKNIFQYYLSWQ